MAHPARSLEEKHRGLTALILCRTAKEASEATGLPEGSLRAWKSRDPEMYEKLRTDLAPRLAERAAADAEEISALIVEKERKILASLDDEKISRLEAKDIAGTLRNLSTSKALQWDKVSSPLRERPSHVQHSTDIGDVVQKLGRMLGFKPETIEDATVVDDHTTTTAVALVSESNLPNAPG